MTLRFTFGPELDNTIMRPSMIKFIEYLKRPLSCLTRGTPVVLRSLFHFLETKFNSTGLSEGLNPRKHFVCVLVVKGRYESFNNKPPVEEKNRVSPKNEK